jgi:predicted MPP superfamily phosphohydrolase
LKRLVGTAALAAAAYSVAIERRWYTLREVTAPLLAPGQRALRLLHISDLHLMPGQSDKVAWVQRLADVRPDLVVSTGDHVAVRAALPSLSRALEPLFAFPGVYVFGSNDHYRARFKWPWVYFAPQHPRPHPAGDRLPVDALHGLFALGQWRSAEDRFLWKVSGQLVEIRGCGDAHLGLDDYAAVAGPPSPAAQLSLGVTHSPYRRVLDAMTADGLGLILAGHTHGGQVCVPGHGALVTNCDLEPRRAKGLSWWQAGGQTAALHVSAGLGTSPYAPFRFACRPEATLLTLVPRAGLG